MKLLKLIPLFAFLMIFVSCDDEKKVETEVVAEAEVENPDQVFTDWTDAWNSGDAEAVRTMVADDAVLVMNGVEVPRDSIAGWIDESAGMMSNLRQSSLQKNNSGNMAYDTGTFSHGVKDNDTLQFRGTYTFIFEKPEGTEQWKAVVMDISDEETMTSEEQ